MDTLPQELINLIASFIPRYGDDGGHPQTFSLIDGSGWSAPEISELPPYATLSESWKKAIESRTFKNLAIPNTELEAFQSIVVGSRREYVAHLTYRVQLPDYGEESYGQPESQEEKDENDTCFTVAIVALLSVLEAWEQGGIRNTIRLEIPPGAASCRTDETLWHDSHLSEKFVRRRFEASFIQLLETPAFALHNVCSLEVNCSGRRRILPLLVPRLANFFPLLKEVDWSLGQGVAHGASISTFARWRQEFADASMHVPLQPRAKARIIDSMSCTSGGPIIPAELSYCPFSASIRTFSHSLKSLSLTGRLDPTLFWPSEHETNAAIPTWPSLQTLDVEVGRIAPNGEPYFQFDTHEVISSPVNRILTALAKAVRSMPVLAKFDVRWDPGDGAFEICYFAPGLKLRADEEGDELSRRICYEVDADWRPSEEVREGLRYAGKEKYGGEIIERFSERLRW